MRNRSRGMALITALWMLAILLVLVAGMAAMVHSETQVARNFGGVTVARWAACAGLHRAEVALLALTEQPYTALMDDDATAGTRLFLTSDDEETDLGGATYEVTIEDEAGKLNLNTVPAEVLNVFFPLEATDAILDWRDADSLPGPQGAEDDYYAGLSPPYRCKNGPFETLGEVRLVSGVTAELLTTPVTEDGQTLEALLTVYSTERNIAADGRPRENLTTASTSAILDAVGTDAELTDEQVNAIVAQRATFESPADLLGVPGLPRETVARIYDRFTTSTAGTRAGLVNLNTAPIEVLLALEGMDEATAAAIVTQREAEGPFETVGNLLDVTQVSDTLFRRIADAFTTRSRRFRVRATGKSTDGVTQMITAVLQVEEQGGERVIRRLYWRE
jgi:general secretion pathway protein K